MNKLCIYCGKEPATASNYCPKCEQDVIDALDESETLRDAFTDAALEYCRLWKRDNRNTHRPGWVHSELDRTRNRMFEAYDALMALNERG